ncbi:GNAT family N-acetyltransferase [Simkania negevensis]|uniref:GNAT family N-acetyltransferase n=1 Tax=Simkania negevensis TaxID=83561 RepID=A0ABS3APW1_9BACT|nr:GNAT family N-acetyltransferase [Simkania negevensis]
MKKEDSIHIRYTTPEDGPYLTKWLAEPGVLQGFAMGDPPEVEDSIKRWIGFSRYKCSLTADWQGTPCGIATLWLMPFRKLRHQCQFGMIVDQQYRRKGIGSQLLNNLLHLAKDYFGIEVIHLEMYENNEAIHLYEKFGFKEFGRQKKFLKDEGDYYGRILMEREL